jgi:hypothetical protein
MSKRKDWADRLAEQIIADVQGIYDPRTREDIVAMRLRIVRQEGVVAGVQEAGDAVQRSF